MDKEFERKLRKAKIKGFFRHTLTKPFKCLFYVFYFMKYPFLQPRNVWTGKRYWSWNKLDNIPQGWRKAFGKQLRNDLRKALIEDGILHTFYFTQIKEKWGKLCLYNNGTGTASDYVINHYQELSMCYCINCGKPARYVTSGYVEYVCEECFDECSNTNRDDYEEYKLSCRLNKEHISHWVSIEDGKEIPLDYGVDFIKLWGLEENGTL